MIDVTGRQMRAPVTRAMLGPQRAGLGTRTPTMFEMTVSTAAGIRDAAETIAHELLHISQAVNGRLNIVFKAQEGQRTQKCLSMWVRWMGGKTHHYGESCLAFATMGNRGVPLAEPTRRGISEPRHRQWRRPAGSVRQAQTACTVPCTCTFHRAGTVGARFPSAVEWGWRCGGGIPETGSPATVNQSTG